MFLTGITTCGDTHTEAEQQHPATISAVKDQATADLEDVDCSALSQGQCHNPDCVWCVSAAVKSKCFTPVSLLPGLLPHYDSNFLTAMVQDSMSPSSKHAGRQRSPCTQETHVRMKLMNVLSVFQYDCTEIVAFTQCVTCQITDTKCHQSRSGTPAGLHANQELSGKRPSAVYLRLICSAWHPDYPLCFTTFN